MALTTEQEIALYNVLEVPWSTTINKLQGDDNLTAITWGSVEPGNTQAYAKIQTRIAEIEAMSAALAVLVAWLDDWIALGSNVTNLEGGMDGLDGLSDSPTRERRELRAKILTIVPFYRCHEEMVGNQAREVSVIIHG